MQTGTKKTPDRFQNYFCPAAANDIVHHAYAWIVKEPNMQPKFLYCRAIDDPANDRGWNIIAEVWETRCSRRMGHLFFHHASRI